MMEEDEYGSRRPRSRNWNTAEKFFLFEHVKNRFDIITDPRKESTSINAKRRVWEQIYQAIAKEFGPLEEHLVRGKGGEKCRTQWKNLVQAARKEYKQYMEAKMVGKRHNMTLLSRKICRLMSIDLDDGIADQDNEENDWTEDHPEFRYQPELCQELREAARRINEEYVQGIYDAQLPEESMEDYEDFGNYEGEVGSDSEADIPDDEKDEDYAPQAKRTPRKRRRASSGRSSGKQPTRTSARAQAAQAKKMEEEKATRKRRSTQAESNIPAAAEMQLSGVISTLNEQTQQEILNLHLVEHKKRMNLMNTEHKTKMQNLKMEKDVMTLQREYWNRKLEILHESSRDKGYGEDEDYEDEEEDAEEDEENKRQMGTEEAGPSGTSAPTSVVVPAPATASYPPEPAAQSPPDPDEPAPDAPCEIPTDAPTPKVEEGPADDEMETSAPQSATSNGYENTSNQDAPPMPPQNEVQQQ